jgi:hypothetical protein
MWLVHRRVLGFIVQTREDEKSEDNDHRTFCRRSHRHGSSRICAGCNKQITECAA